MRLTAKVFLNEQDVVDALGTWARKHYPDLIKTSLVIEVCITKGKYSAIVEAEEKV